MSMWTRNDRIVVGVCLIILLLMVTLAVLGIIDMRDDPETRVGLAVQAQTLWQCVLAWAT